MVGNTNRERILQNCKEKLKSEGTPPTIQELAYALDLSITTVAYHLGMLEKQGKIKRTKHKARGIQVVE